jgi:hypothetical protein
LGAEPAPAAGPRFTSQDADAGRRAMEARYPVCITSDLDGDLLDVRLDLRCTNAEIVRELRALVALARGELRERKAAPTRPAGRPRSALTEHPFYAGVVRREVEEMRAALKAAWPRGKTPTLEALGGALRRSPAETAAPERRPRPLTEIPPRMERPRGN